MATLGSKPKKKRKLSAKTSTLSAERFYLANRKNNAGSNEVIEEFLRGNEAIVFGARSVNKHLPSHLDRHTADWDLLTPKDAKRVAREIERRLDKRYGGDFFIVEPAQHAGTMKVRDRITGTAVADISGLKEVVPSVKIDGINFVTLDHRVRDIKRSLADPESSFRHPKDRESLQRIDIFRANHPNYFVSDLKEVLGREFDVQLTSRGGVLRVQGKSRVAVREKTLKAVAEFLDKFYPQLEFEKVNGSSVIRKRTSSAGEK